MTTTKPPGYWKKEENAIAETTKVMTKHKWNTLPSSNELRKHGYNSLARAINKYHSGMSVFRTTLGQTNTKKPQGYWQSLENTINEARKAMKKHEWEILPPPTDLKKNKYSSLCRAIFTYHGGFRAFRAKLGQQTPGIKQQGYWQQEENAIAEAQQIMQERGWSVLPQQAILEKHGYSSLTGAISKYHGGYIIFRKKLGQTNTRKPRGYWQKLENIISEARQVMKKHNWKTLPSARELEKHRYSSLSVAIQKYCKGHKNFREILTEQETGKTPKQQLEELLDEYIAA